MFKVLLLWWQNSKENNMSECPHKEGLTRMPDRIIRLPIDKRGYPIPWFVATIDGEPDFRVIGPDKFVRAIKEQLCWVCGDRMGSFKTFVVGPMCGLNRTSAEPPSHLECARWSAVNCPFLSKPNMKRREDDLTKSLEPEVPGVMIKRNPGTTLLWTTKRYELFKDGRGGWLINIGDPHSTEWYAEGKIATKEQIKASIESGLPLLQSMAKEDGQESMNALQLFTKNYFEYLGINQ